MRWLPRGAAGSTIGAIGEARYDGYADWYDEHLSRFTGAATAYVLDLLGERTGHCLEVGCGGGVHLRALGEGGWIVVGVDLSADQLRVARGRVPDVDLLRADAIALPFVEAAFDASVTAFVHGRPGPGASARARRARLSPSICFFRTPPLRWTFAVLHRPAPRPTGLLCRPNEPSEVTEELRQLAR